VAAELPLADFLNSLARTAAAPDALLVAAHCPVTESVHQRVAELLAHHERRLQLTEDQVQVGARSVYEVAQVLRWTRRERELVTLDPLNRMLAVMETKAHLDVFVHRGSADRRLEGDCCGIRRMRCPPHRGKPTRRRCGFQRVRRSGTEFPAPRDK
jgi:hypothetical protein